MTAAIWILGAFVACGWVYWALAVVAAERWRRTRMASTTVMPGVSVLKPLRGHEPELLENLASFCTQAYPSYEVICVAEDPADPALAVAAEAARRHPQCAVRILSGSPTIGANRKVCNLAHALRAARYELIVVSDSDMRVDADYLSRIVAPFAEPSTGVLTCLYRSRHPQGFASSLEALGIGAEFIPSVLVAWLFAGPVFGFGSTIAIRREVLERLGGFGALADELADDYRLCQLARETGARQVLSDYVVDYVPGRQSFRDVWVRRVRWARTIRRLQPAGAVGSVITNVCMFSLAVAAVRPTAAAWWLVAGSILWRAICAGWIALRCTGDASVLRLLWLLPLHDVFSFGVWAAGLCAHRVRWRDRDLSVGPGGRLRTAPATTRAAGDRPPTSNTPTDPQKG